MTPAEHYAEAERLLADAETVVRTAGPIYAGHLHAAAQVHATLATVPDPTALAAARGAEQRA